MCHQPLDISLFANHWQVSGNCTSPDQLENGTFGQTLNSFANNPRNCSLMNYSYFKYMTYHLLRTLQLRDLSVFKWNFNGYKCLFGSNSDWFPL